MVGRDFEAGRDHQEGLADDQRGHQLDGAAPHRDHRRVVRRRHLRHVGPGVRQPVHVPLADGEDRRDGPQADRGRDVDRAPRPGRPQGRADSTRRRTPGSSPRSRRSRRRARSRSSPPAPISDDGIIDPRDTRTVLGMCLSVVRNRPIEGADGLRGVPAVSDRSRALLVANRGEIARRVFRTRARDGDALRRGLRRRRRRRAVRGRGRRGGPPARSATSTATAILAAARASRRRRDPPRLRLPVRERRLRGRGRRRPGWPGSGRRPTVDRGDGRQARGQGARPSTPGVPTLPSSDDPDADGEVGYPLLVKAAAGGGGKGMRIVDAAGASSPRRSPRRGARRRAASATTGSSSSATCRAARHVEIQILGDAHGGLVHLGERECSIQRRHQKIVEESPSPRVDADAARPRWATPRCGWRARSATSRRARSSSWSTTPPASSSSSRSTRGSRSSTRSPRRSRHRPGARAAAHRRRASRSATAQDDVTFRGHADRGAPVRRGPRGRLPARHRHARRLRAGRRARGALGLRRRGGLGGRRRLRPDARQGDRPRARRAREAAGRLALALERLHLGGVTTNRDFLAAALRTRRSSPATPPPTSSTASPRRATLELADDELERVAHARRALAAGRQPGRGAGARRDPERLAQRAPARPSSVALAHGDDAIDVRYQPRRDGAFAASATATAARPRPPLDARRDRRRDRRAAHAAPRHAGRRSPLRAGAARHRRRSTSCPASSCPAPRRRHGRASWRPCPAIVLDVRCRARRPRRRPARRWSCSRR